MSGAAPTRARAAAVLCGATLAAALTGLLLTGSSVGPALFGPRGWVTQNLETDLFAISAGSSGAGARPRDGETHGDGQEKTRLPRPELVRAADAGSGYPLRHENETWKVVLYGGEWEPAARLSSGCPTGTGKCPLNPSCTITRRLLQDHFPGKANVVVIASHGIARGGNHGAFLEMREWLKAWNGTGAERYGVMFWREADEMWKPPPVVQRGFSFMMGFHYRAAIANPSFMLPPHLLYNNTLTGGTRLVPWSERPLFAVSFVSHCGSISMRDDVLDHLVKVLGKHRVHRYGDCGDGHTLSKTKFWERNLYINTIAKYKFYLALENTIQPGYCTEKLYWILSMGIVPVYYGDPRLFNISQPEYPLFINAFDFRGPHELAKHLLRVGESAEEYGRYTRWRSAPAEDVFTEEFLDLVARKVPGPREMQLYADAVAEEGLSPTNAIRRALCCRLCSREFVREMADSPDHAGESFALHWSKDHVRRAFVAG